MSSDPGKRLGKYLIKSRIGQGGMGIVYLATDLRLQRDVAIKFLPKEIATDSDAVKRFQREARAAARLHHPNVVVVHDVDHQQGETFLVMELVTGGNVQQLLHERKLPWQEATRIVAESCRGLAAAHNAGLIHRDIKPSNIMLSKDGTVKLADFGLAKETTGGNPLTKSAAIFGTPDYMSPEQCRGDSLDARSDVYSLGATYFTMLTGQPPFAAEQALQVMFAHCSKSPPNPRTFDESIPDACAEIVLKALAKNRTERYVSAEDLRTALLKLLAEAPAASAPPANVTSHVALHAAPTMDIRGPQVKIAVGEPTIQFNMGGPSQSPRTKFSGQWLVGSGAVVTLLLVGIIGRWIAGMGNDPLNNSGNSSGTIAIDRPLTNSTPAGNYQLKLLHQLPSVNTTVQAIAFSAGNQRLYAGSLDGGVREWDWQAKTVLREFRGTTGVIRTLAAHREWLVAGGTTPPANKPQTVWLWKPGMLEPTYTIPDLQGEISALAINVAGDRLAVGTYAELRLYELQATSPPKLIAKLGVSGDPKADCYMVKSVAFSPDDEWLAATTWGVKGAILWNGKSGELKQIYRGEGADSICITFLPTSDAFFFGTQSHGIWRCDVQSTTPRLVNETKGTNFRALTALGDGRTIVGTGEWGGDIFLFDLGKQARLTVIKGNTTAGALAQSLTSDGQHFATAGGSGGEEHEKIVDKPGYIQVWSITESRP